MTVEVPPLLNLTLEVSLLEGRNLVAKDRNKLGLGKATSSDPLWKSGWEDASTAQARLFRTT